MFLVAANVKNKSNNIDSNTTNIPPIKNNNLVIKPKLEVRVLSGEFEKWGDAITIQKPDSVTFRWAYFGSNAKSALWYLSDKPFDSPEKPNLLKRGQIKYIPEHGKFGLFDINLSNYLPPKPHNYSTNYYVRVVPLNEKFAPIESPSLPVTIIYRQPAEITQFHPFEFDEKMQTKRFKPYYNIRIHAIRTADTDGTNSANVTAEEINTMIKKANLGWWLSGIQFLFDPKNDFENINLTQLNRIYSLDDHILLTKLNAQLPSNKKLNKEQTDSYKEYDKIKKSFADKYTNKLVLFFHYGSMYEKKPQETDFTYVPDSLLSGHHTPFNKNYYLVPGHISELGSNRRAPYVQAYYLAHRLGHFFGLYDTYINSYIAFPDQAAEALKNAIESGSVSPINAMSIFDNDKNTVTDTPPDLGNGFFSRNYRGDKCIPETSIKIQVSLKKGFATYELNPDKTNLMSDFISCSNKNGIPQLTIQQIKRARYTLENGSRKYLIQ